LRLLVLHIMYLILHCNLGPRFGCCPRHYPLTVTYVYNIIVDQTGFYSYDLDICAIIQRPYFSVGHNPLRTYTVLHIHTITWLHCLSSTLISPYPRQALCLFRHICYPHRELLRRNTNVPKIYVGAKYLNIPQ
jgi:hypothetical protein